MTDYPITTYAASDVGSALDAARENFEQVADAEHAVVIARRSDVLTETIDLERFKPQPRRKAGTIQALTADGFLAAFSQRDDGDHTAAVYANPDKCTLEAILNDDGQDAPGWRDHRITYAPQPTPEWKHWTENQGLKKQDEFAAILEGGETEIVNPSATVMLDLAETFHASSAAKFKQAGRRRDGRVQFVYEEDIEAKAGDGMVDVPESFTIRLRPFYGAEPVEVVCKLRFRLAGGDLTIGYSIHRPDEIRRESFLSDVVATVRAAVGDLVVEANAPAAR